VIASGLGWGNIASIAISIVLAFFFGYALTPPYLTYHCADATGRLIQSSEIDVPGPTMMHDFAITATFIAITGTPPAI